MRSTVDVAAALRSGTTVLRRARAGGHFAVRQTAPGTVHLVGTAAGPLGGDEVVIGIDVGAGAHLRIRSSAATIVLPGRVDPVSRLRFDVRVAPGGRLDMALEPTVVCAGADHHVTTVVHLVDDAEATIREDVVLGRAGEAPGSWTGTVHIVRDGVPLLRHTIPAHVLGNGPGAPRALISEVRTGTLADRAGTCGSAVILPLAAGGVLGTATGADLTTARRDLRQAWAGVPRPARAPAG